MASLKGNSPPCSTESTSDSNRSFYSRLPSMHRRVSPQLHQYSYICMYMLYNVWQKNTVFACINECITS